MILGAGKMAKPTTQASLAQEDGLKRGFDGMGCELAKEFGGTASH